MFQRKQSRVFVDELSWQLMLILT